MPAIYLAAHFLFSSMKWGRLCMPCTFCWLVLCGRGSKSVVGAGLVRQTVAAVCGGLAVGDGADVTWSWFLLVWLEVLCV